MLSRRRLPQNPLTGPGKASTNYPRQPHPTEGRLELRNGGFGPPAIGTVPAPMYCKPRHAIGGAIVASMSLVVVTFVKRHIASTQGGLPMRLSFAIRAALIALTVTGAGLATAAYADSGTIRFNVLKAGFVVGGSAGSGTLVFHSRRYRLAIGGVSYGFTFGASAIDFVGTVRNIRTASDVNGVYGRSEE